MDRSAVYYTLPQPFITSCGYTLWKRQFPRHENWYSHLVSGNIWIWRNHTTATKIHTLAHHFHSKHTFLALQQLSNAWLATVDCLLGHR